MDALIFNTLMLLFSFVASSIIIQIIMMFVDIFLTDLDIKYNKIKYNPVITHRIGFIVSIILSVYIYYELFIDVY